MNWDFSITDIKINIAGFGSLIAALTLYALNGTLNQIIPILNMPEMDINEGIALFLAIIGGGFTLMKLANEILKFMRALSDWREEKKKRKIKEHNKKKMPLKTREEKKAAIKWIVQQIKIYVVAVGAAGASVWGVAQYYLEDYVKQTVVDVIEEKNGNKSFREILGEQMNIPADIVPYHITKKITALDSLISDIQDFEDTYLPHLDFQMSIQPTYFFWLDGAEYWMGPDGYDHGVMYDTDGKWCVYHGQRKDL